MCVLTTVLVLAVASEGWARDTGALVTGPYAPAFAGETPASLSGRPSSAERRTLNYLLTRLDERPALADPNLQITAQDGDVTLRGVVASSGAQREVDRLAHGIPGVRSVRDALRVDRALAPPVQASLQDDHLAASVSRAIVRCIPGAQAQQTWLYGWQVMDPQQSWMIDVEADRGLVLLNGTVPSPAVLGTILASVARVPGVLGVEDFLAGPGTPTLAAGGPPAWDLP